ncbi:hypothetical protein BaRGS_00000447 [Batillaria attramentaria]|uniref:Uncharacterized protein n=1 Tax=Batillaria attramentaria TaxID=370345 RepID=A0ABD0M8R5_9CAEN
MPFPMSRPAYVSQTQEPYRLNTAPVKGQEDNAPDSRTTHPIARGQRTRQQEDNAPDSQRTTHPTAGGQRTRQQDDNAPNSRGTTHPTARNCVA